MKKSIRIALLITVLALLLSGCVFGGSKKIGKDAALQIALTDAGLTSSQIVDLDIEVERDMRTSWYEIDFESGRTEYEYKIDAFSGEILSARTD
ncbi:MAG: PepSY domain-containing protein [Oscillospiraceae bacterium]|nr:PepSY domain-containing protein [Oscillospiraceae bacterium]